MALMDDASPVLFNLHDFSPQILQFINIYKVRRSKTKLASFVMELLVT